MPIIIILCAFTGIVYLLRRALKRRSRGPGKPNPTSTFHVPPDDDKEGHINKLPESLLLRIFLYLSKADIVHTMGTCRRFNKIGKDHTLWEFMNLAGKPVEETSLHCILDRRMQVLRLTEAKLQAARPSCLATCSGVVSRQQPSTSAIFAPSQSRLWTRACPAYGDEGHVTSTEEEGE